MTQQELLAMCMAKPGAEETRPFGPVPVCVKVGNRIFAQIYAGAKHDQVTFSCTREGGELYQAAFPEAVFPGHHCPAVQRPFFITVSLTGEVPDSYLAVMANHAYNAVVAKLPKYVRETLPQEP